MTDSLTPLQAIGDTRPDTNTPLGYKHREWMSTKIEKQYYIHNEI